MIPWHVRQDLADIAADRGGKDDRLQARGGQFVDGADHRPGLFDRGDEGDRDAVKVVRGELRQQGVAERFRGDAGAVRKEVDRPKIVIGHERILPHGGPGLRIRAAGNQLPQPQRIRQLSSC